MTAFQMMDAFNRKQNIKGAASYRNNNYMSWVPFLIRSSRERGRSRYEGEEEFLPRELLFWIRYTTVICLAERKN
jgi:hypothetical protein